MFGSYDPGVLDFFAQCLFFFGGHPTSLEIAFTVVVAGNKFDREPAVAVVPDVFFSSHLGGETGEPEVVDFPVSEDSSRSGMVRVMEEGFVKEIEGKGDQFFLSCLPSELKQRGGVFRPERMQLRAPGAFLDGKFGREFLSDGFRERTSAQLLAIDRLFEGSELCRRCLITGRFPILNQLADFLNEGGSDFLILVLKVAEVLAALGRVLSRQRSRGQREEQEDGAEATASEVSECEKRRPSEKVRHELIRA